MKLKIPFRPKAKLRHREVMKDGKRWCYHPGAKDEQAFGLLLRAAMRAVHANKETGPVVVKMRFMPDCVEIEVEKASHGRTSLRGDLDNYEKFALDSANEILWDDDKQVVEIHSTFADAQEELPLPSLPDSPIPF